MNLYISCDMEGTAGVCTWVQVDPSNHDRVSNLSPSDVPRGARAIDGARDRGPASVLINDSHASMRNLLWDELPDDVRMITGNRKPFSMAQGADGRSTRHSSPAITRPTARATAVLDHTYTSETLYETRINGKRCNEAMLNAAVLGLDGVPVVLVTGDRTSVDETRAAMPWVVGVAVKDAIGRYATNSVSPARACDLIRAGASEAIGAIPSAKPYTFEPPIALEIDFVYTHNADFAELIPGFERIGGRTVRFVHDDFRVVFRAYVAAFRLGAAAEPARVTARTVAYQGHAGAFSDTAARRLLSGAKTVGYPSFDAVATALSAAKSATACCRSRTRSPARCRATTNCCGNTRRCASAARRCSRSTFASSAFMARRWAACKKCDRIPSRSIKCASRSRATAGGNRRRPIPRERCAK